MDPLKRQIIRAGVQRWEVDFGYVDGKRERHLCKDEAAADAELAAYLKKTKGVGDYLARLTESERGMIVAIHREVTASGKTLSGVWGAYQEHKKEVAAQSTTTPKLYTDVVEAFREKKSAAGDSTRYVKNTCTFLHKFGIGREKQNIHEITHHDLDTWLTQMGKTNEWSLRTKDTYQVLFSSLWSLAVKNGWAAANIVERLEAINLPGVEVKIFTHDETLNLMAAVMSSDATKAIIAPMTLGFFGCMRPEEVESKRAKTEGVPTEKWFGWDDIDLKHGLVKVRKEIAKVGNERTIRRSRLVWSG